MNMREVVLLGLIVVLGPLSLLAQTLSPTADLILNLDYSRFRYDDESGYLEVYYSIHPQQLTYDFHDGEFHGGVILSTRIKLDSTNALVVNQRSLLELSETDTSAVWYRYPFITQAGYAIEHGSYTLEVVATDSLAPARRDSLVLDLTLNQYGSELAVSDVELCKNITSSTNKSDPFYKNSLEVVPYPPLIYGASSIPTTFYYVELYNLTPSHSYNVRTEILNSRGESVYEKSKSKKYSAKNFLEVGAAPVTAYPSGKYTFRFALLDENETELTRTDKTFFLLNQHMDAVAQRESLPSSGDFESLSDKDLSQEFQFARYIATKEETETFSGLETEEAKRVFLARFWADVARGRMEVPPIDRASYLDRAGVANERYAALSKEGWQTDRGRVLMIYAEPEEVERAPHQSDTKPYEIWRYFSIENGVEFVFVDRLGFGNLELVHSTKRNEFRDEAWQRFLQ